MPRTKNAMSVTTPTVRCAIYTRKSTEEGLEQEFNTLHAQREAGEAYVASQRGEGWTCLPTLYDDGGFTGGNIERSALKRLLQDIESGEVDCVIVYKVDRLNRSLNGFTRVMEIFERHHVSFVSVTQAFNTTSSMGRLTLNILLSFAQFEREIISERTRDKMAAARRKGKYLGGPPLLGYDVDREKTCLVVNDREAARVRKIFELYLEKGSLLATIAELDQRNWMTKVYVTRKGDHRGGKPFNKTRLHHLLTNVAYIGKVRYKDEVHTGQHAAIVDADLFRQVQQQLVDNRINGKRHTRTTTLLQGLLFCGSCNCAMTPSYTTKRRTKRYRYYVCTNAQKRGWHSCPSKSIPAGQIEEYVVDHIRSIGQDETLLEQTITAVRAEQAQTQDSATEQQQKLTIELANANRELQRLSCNPATLKPAELAAVQDRIQRTETRLRETERQRYHGPVISDDQIRTALRQFDQVWDSLSLKDRSRILQLLIERVEYDGAESTVSIHFHTHGIESLMTEIPAGAIP